MTARVLDGLLVLAVMSVVAGVVLLAGLAGTVAAVGAGLLAGGLGLAGLTYALAPDGGGES